MVVVGGGGWFRFGCFCRGIVVSTIVVVTVVTVTAQNQTGGLPKHPVRHIHITCGVQVWFCLRLAVGLGWCRVGFVLPLFENVFSGRRVFQDGHRSHLCRLDAARSCRCMIVYPRFRVSSSLTVQRVGVCGGLGCGVDCIRGVVGFGRGRGRRC